MIRNIRSSNAHKTLINLFCMTEDIFGSLSFHIYQNKLKEEFILLKMKFAKGSFSQLLCGIRDSTLLSENRFEKVYRPETPLPERLGCCAHPVLIIQLRKGRSNQIMLPCQPHAFKNISNFPCVNLSVLWHRFIDA